MLPELRARVLLTSIQKTLVEPVDVLESPLLERLWLRDSERETDLV